MLKAYWKATIRANRYCRDEKNWGEVRKVIEEYPWQRDFGWDTFDRSLLESQYMGFRHVPSDGCPNKKGLEMMMLVVFSVFLLAWPLERLCELEKGAITAYVEGLNEAGWKGDSREVRLGYVTGVAEAFGAALPYILSRWCIPEHREFEMRQFGVAGNQLYEAWLPLLPYSLDCADEARSLMKQLGYPR